MILVLRKSWVVQMNYRVKMILILRSAGENRAGGRYAPSRTLDTELAGS